MPPAIAAGAVGFSIAGGGLKAASARAAADANVGIDKANAGIADQAAGVALQNGQQQATVRAMAGGRLAGSQKAGFSASGVSTGSGSALDVLGDTAAVSEMDQRVIQNNAARTAWGYEAQGANFRSKAALDDQEGTSEEVSSILGGVTSAAGSAAQMKLG